MTHMEIKGYFQIVRNWLWLIVISAFLAGGAAYLVSRQQTPVYEASTTMLINQMSNSMVTDYTGIMVSERLAKTYSQMLRQRPLIEETTTELGLDLTPKELLEKIEVAPVRDTQLLVVTVQDTDPALVAALANKIPEIFIRNNQQILEGRRTAAKESLASQIEAVEREIATLETTIATMGDPIDEYDKMDRARMQDTLARYRSNWSTLLDSYQQIVVAEAQSTDSVVIVEPAQVPELPIGPNTRRNVLLATLVGAMMGLGAAFLIEYLDDSIKTGDDVQAALGLPVLGVIGQMRIQGARHMLVAAEHPRATVAESLRVLRANIQFLGVDRPVGTMLITSAGPGEGKSLTTANLGVVMAQAGSSVIVVDTDLRRPIQHLIFDLSPDRGLTNALVGREDGLHLDGLLQPTEIENLQVLTAGPLPPNPADLVGSRRMGELIEELKQRADVVLFDSPPSLVAADASLLASQVDGTLMVIETGNTPQPSAVQAKETLEKAGGRLLGVVLNKLSQRSSSYYYYYSQYYGDDKEGKRKGRQEPAPPGRAGSPVTAIKHLFRRVLPGNSGYAADGR